MEALPLGRVATKSLTKFDSNVGVGKFGDVGMPQRMETPLRNLRPLLPALSRNVPLTTPAFAMIF